jgi:hypothetical protein
MSYVRSSLKPITPVRPSPAQTQEQGDTHEITDDGNCFLVGSHDRVDLHRRDDSRDRHLHLFRLSEDGLRGVLLRLQLSELATSMHYINMHFPISGPLSGQQHIYRLWPLFLLLALGLELRPNGEHVSVHDHHELWVPSDVYAENDHEPGLV